MAVFPICLTRDVCDTCYASIAAGREENLKKNLIFFVEQSEDDFVLIARLFIVRFAKDTYAMQREWQNFLFGLRKSRKFYKKSSELYKPTKKKSASAVFTQNRQH